MSTPAPVYVLTYTCDSDADGNKMKVAATWRDGIKLTAKCIDMAIEMIKKMGPVDDDAWNALYAEDVEALNTAKTMALAAENDEVGLAAQLRLGLPDGTLMLERVEPWTDTTEETTP